jgi:hypothetical protein
MPGRRSLKISVQDEAGNQLARKRKSRRDSIWPVELRRRARNVIGHRLD